MSSLVTCKTCGNQFLGNFCNVCGEKIIDQKDRKLKYFIGELINALTFADNKLWRSLKMVAITPGKLSQLYVEGIRQKYMKPLSIFFLANLLYFLFPFVNTFTTTLDLQTSSFFYSDLAESMVKTRLENRGIALAEYEKEYNNKTTELSRLLLIFMAIMITPLFAFIHLGGDKKLIADHLTISVELMGFILFYNIQLLSLIIFGFTLIIPALKVLGNNFWLTTISSIFILYFCTRMQLTFYGFKGFRLVLNTILCMFSIALALFSYRGLLFLVTYLTT